MQATKAKKSGGMVTVLKEYFGLLPGQSLSQFAAELKGLTPEEKLELAQGAAPQLGYAPEDVDFPLA